MTKAKKRWYIIELDPDDPEQLVLGPFDSESSRDDNLHELSMDMGAQHLALDVCDDGVVSCRSSSYLDFEFNGDWHVDLDHKEKRQ